MEVARFERQVRTSTSEAFQIFVGSTRIGRIDIHFAQTEVIGSLLLEKALSLSDQRSLIEQIDEDIVQSYDPVRDDFSVTVFQGKEVGFFSDGLEDDRGQAPPEDDEGTSTV